MLERSFVSLGDGDRPVLTPLAILRSSRLRWPLLRLRYGLRTNRGKLVPSRKLLCWTSLRLLLLQLIFLLHTALLWAPLLGRVCARFGWCPGFRLLLLFWSALLLALLPRLQRSVHCARALVLLAV